MPEINYVLTDDEVRDALYVDPDFSQSRARYYASLATSYLKQKTGYNWENDPEIEPLAKQCAILYVRTQYFEGSNYKKEYDYTLGISSLLVDLEIIAQAKLAAEVAS
jgi:hypothetical protein